MRSFKGLAGFARPSLSRFSLSALILARRRSWAMAVVFCEITVGVT